MGKSFKTSGTEQLTIVKSKNMHKKKTSETNERTNERHSNKCVIFYNSLIN